MISVIRRHWRIYASVLGVLAVVALGLFVVQPKAEATFVSGNPGAAGSGSGGNGYYTSHGFGWKLFDVSDSTGPNGGFKSGSWGAHDKNGVPTDNNSISGKCYNVGADKVWVFVIRDGAGDEKGYTFTNTYQYYQSKKVYDNNSGASVYPTKSWWIDRPGAGGDPYEYNNSGVYDGVKRYGGSSGYGAADTVVEHVRGLYQQEGGDRNTWGWNVGWFCYDDNPPWNVTVTSTPNETVAEPGETITWTHTVTNVGANKTNQKINVTYQNSGDLGTGSGTLSPIASGLAKNSPSSQTGPPYVVQVSDFGKKLCENATAAPSTNNGGTISSTPTCVLVAKKPKVQVLGGDIQTGLAFSGSTAPSASNITTSTSSIAGVLYGSWGQYGALASGIITANGLNPGFASGAAYHANAAGGLACASNCAVNALSLTNQVPTSIGSYKSTSSTIPDISAAFPITKPTDPNPTPVYTSTSDLATEAAKKQIETTDTNANITINGGTIGKGNWLVINAPTATVTIVGDINYYPGTLNGINDIPQIVIIANTINIAGNVKNVDAWLIASGASGVINTCSDVVAGGNLSGAVCNKPLTVHGPVMAKKIYLQRTAGGDAPSNIGDPGETFDLRPDAYLWASARGIDQLHLYNAATTELPPRF